MLEKQKMLLYAIKEEDKENLCEKRNYSIVTPDGKVLYADKTLADLINEGYTIYDESTFNELWDELWANYEKKLCGKWKEITEQSFNDALNILPPFDWRSGGFFMGELYTGNIGYFYQEYCGKFYVSMQNTKRDRREITQELESAIRSGSVAAKNEEGN